MEEALQQLATPVDLAFVDAPGASARFGNDDFTADPAAAKAMLGELAVAFDEQRFGTMIEELHGKVLQTVAGSFGLGKLVSALDRNGGNVDTVHDARKGVYASDGERERYENRDPYDKDAVHQHKKYEKANAAMGQSRDAGTSHDT